MIKKILFLATTIFSLNTFASGSTIANGGDPLFSFLEDTRFIMNRVALEFGDSKVQEQICEGLKNLSFDQKNYCKRFILATREDLRNLNSGEQKTKFTIEKEPLYVERPSGGKITVAARTLLGPAGPVEFHRGTLLTLSPFNLALLMVHEFGHKVDFEGGHITDDKKYGPFATGRELLDTVGKAYATYATQKNYIGSYFGVNDYFNCESRFPGTALRPRPYRGRSPRIYYSSDYKVYETGVGRNEDDFHVEEYDADFNLISFKIKISEQFACGQVGSETSKTRLEIVKTPAPNENGELLPTEILNSYEISGNPLCSDMREPMTLGVPGLEFSCEYKYSKGLSHNNFNAAKNYQ